MGSETDQRLRCGGCSLTLGTFVGNLLVSSHKGRRDITYPITIVCPRCETAWHNPEARISDAMGSVITESLRTAKTTPFVPSETGAAA